jgi:hypothetical protein
MTGQGLGRFIAAIVAALFALLMLPAAAHAAAGAPGERVCVSYGSLDTTLAPPAGWDCSGKRASLEPERVFLRFPLPASGAAPEYVTFRRAAFERLHLLVIDADGAVRAKSYGLSDMKAGEAGAFIRAALPPVTQQSRYAIAAFDLPTHSMMLESAELGRGDPAENPRQLRTILLLAGLCGMLLMPLAFNIAYYRVLRESFLMCHYCLSMILLSVF